MRKITKEQYEFALTRIEELLPLVTDETPANDRNAVELTMMSDIKVDFPATDYVGNQRYVFNIRGNKYRLVVVVKFTIGHIFIRFVGTHSEYDRIDVSTI